MDLSHTVFVGLNALHTTPNPNLQSAVPPTYQHGPIYTMLPMMYGPVYQSLPPFSSVMNPFLHATPSGGTIPPLTSSVGLYSSTNTLLEHAMEKKLAEMEAMIQ